MDTPLAIPDGLHRLPAGKLPAVVTFLERLAPPAALPAPAPGVALEPWTEPAVPEYRALFAEIGEPWLWSSRALMSDEAVAATLASSATLLWRAMRAGRAIGLAECVDEGDGSVEINLFGVVPGSTGAGVGRWFLAAVLAELWQQAGTRRVWLHTCTHDHPAALAFYRRAGFRPFAYAVEVADDPRLTGALPATAAPHVPVIA